MSDPKNHHYLPQFYLRGFAGPNEVLYQIAKSNDARFISTKVSKSGSKRDFHTLDWVEQRDRATVEAKLSMLEGSHAKMLKSLLDGGECLQSARAELCEFVALTHHRVPSFKQSVEEFLK